MKIGVEVSDDLEKLINDYREKYGSSITWIVVKALTNFLTKKQ